MCEAHTASGSREARIRTGVEVALFLCWMLRYNLDSSALGRYIVIVTVRGMEACPQWPNDRKVSRPN